ncbi:hypothetical protein PVL29_023208 [Vitis rotundifolia]|uniref:Uncharacterized protein n=1 Tax=Vitis rotundifolia TaxID=103349 RepID=A0AA39D8W1_VITRO|nr:hypothetical protein PVL29_023208 [Vitis rotundifolia]
MAEHAKGSRAASESSLEKITDELQSHGSSSSDSISDPDKTASPSSVKAKDFRLFGREQLVHTGQEDLSWSTWWSCAETSGCQQVRAAGT